MSQSVSARTRGLFVALLTVATVVIAPASPANASIDDPPGGFNLCQSNFSLGAPAPQLLSVLGPSFLTIGVPGPVCPTNPIDCPNASRRCVFKATAVVHAAVGRATGVVEFQFRQPGGDWRVLRGGLEAVPVRSTCSDGNQTSTNRKCPAEVRFHSEGFAQGIDLPADWQFRAVCFQGALSPGAVTVNNTVTCAAGAAVPSPG